MSSIAVTYGTFSVTYGTVLVKCQSLITIYWPQLVFLIMNLISSMWQRTSILGIICFFKILKVQRETLWQNISGQRFVSRTWQSLKTAPCNFRHSWFYGYCAFLNADQMGFSQVNIECSRNRCVMKFLRLKLLKLNPSIVTVPYVTHTKYYYFFTWVPEETDVQFPYLS